MSPLRPDAQRQPQAGQATDPRALLQSALDAVADNVAVLDRRGTIVLTNIAWRQFAMAYSPLAGRPTAHSDVGANYLEVASRDPQARGESGRAVQGIRDVLAGSLEAFSMAYPCHTPDDQHWFTMTVTPLLWDGERGALVMHTDTTPSHHLNRC